MTDKTPWTPGPWKWWTSNSWKRLSAKGDGDVLAPVVAFSDGHPDLLVKPADMQLIEVAPEMASLLLDVCGNLEWDAETVSNLITPDWVDQARAALAKARDEQ